MVLTPFLLLFANLFNIFILKIDSFWPFILGNIIIYYIIFMGLETYFLQKYIEYDSKIDYTEIKKHFKIGSIIMVANLSTMFLFRR